MLSQKVFSKSAHTQKVGGWGKILAWLSNVRVRQTNFKAKVVGNTHTRTHVQPVKVTNRVAIKFHMLITCVALVAPPLTLHHPWPTRVYYPHRQMAPNCACIAVSPFARHICIERTFWCQLYRNIFAILSWQRCVAVALALWLFYCHIYLQSSRTQPFTPLALHSADENKALLLPAFSTFFCSLRFVEHRLRMRFPTARAICQEIGFTFFFSFPIFGPFDISRFEWNAIV